MDNIDPARTCRNCRWSGMDMDLDPYCAQPKVVEKYLYGVVLSSTKILEFCPSPALPLFELRKK